MDIALKEQILECVADTADVPVDELRPDTNLREIGIDSMAAVSIAIDVERLCGITISTDELKGLETVGDILRLIDANDQRGHLRLKGQ